VETIVLHLEAGPRRLREVRVNLGMSMQHTKNKLENLGLTPNRGQRFWIRLLPLIVVLAGVIPLAIICTNQALKLNVRPGLWSTLWFFAAVTGFGYFVKAPRRTLRGDRVLKQLIQQNDNILALRRRDAVPPELLPLGVALFGTAILTGTALAPLGKDLSSQASGSGGCAGCGAGGGCSGGCGGGCGGCGG
jgi:uncharacterized protein (TIGR04222 family)